MALIGYINKLEVNTALVCITEYTINKVKHYGLSIRYYFARKDNDDLLFSDGKSNDYKEGTMVTTVNEFVAVVKYHDFDPDKDIDYYLHNFPLI